jgi:ATP-dependent Clp protease ATP-binding subunit ClpA
VLESLEITVDRVRAEVVRVVGSGKEATSGQIPFTPRAKKVLELALREALSLDHNYIGTEHILLGLVRENEGVASRILLSFDADAEKVRNAVIRDLSLPGAQRRPETAASTSLRLMETGPASHRREGRHPIDPGWLGGMLGVLNRLAHEIRCEHGREPDEADLLLVLAAAPQTLAAQALQRLNVNLDELWAQAERARAEAREAHAQLIKEIEETRVEKERTIQAQQFETAAAHRDRQRELTQQLLAYRTASEETLQHLRKLLGLPAPPPDWTTPD